MRKEFLFTLAFLCLLFSAFNPLSAEVKTFSLPEADLEIHLDTSTGLVKNMFSTCPNRMLAVGQMEIYAVVNGQKLVFDQIVRQSVKAKQFTYDLACSTYARAPLGVRVIYSLSSPELFQEQVIFTAREKLIKPVKLGLRHHWKPQDWDKLLGGTRPMRVVKATEPTYYAFGKAINDQNLTHLDQYQSATMPVFIATRKDRFLLTGNQSVDCYMTLSPNMPENSFPSVQRNPLSMKKGKQLSLTLAFKSFDNRHLLRDVWRWFMNSLTTHYASLRPYLFKVPQHPRVMGAGNWCSFTYYKDFREKRMPPASHIWWSMWHDQIKERYPITGEWWVNIPWSEGKMSAERQQREIARIQKMGHHPYLYFRNLVNTKCLEKGDIRPDWIKTNEEGDFERYGTGRGIGWDLPEKVTTDTGYKRVQWGFLNFANADMRAWYLDSVKKCLTYYKPYGIAMDFSWKSNELGVQVLQGQIVDYIRKNYPNMKVAINDASGSPGQLLADVVLIENGFLGSKTFYDYEMAKALRTNFIALERFNLFENVMRHLLEGKKTWLGPFAVKDAKHFLDYSLANKKLPRQLEECKNAAHLRAGMRNLAIGAGWGYIEECPNNHFVSQFAGDINGLIPLTESFQVQIDGTSDKKGLIYAAAWASDDKIRVAVFNDEIHRIAPRIDIKLPGSWRASRSLTNGKAWNVSSYGTKVPVKPNVSLKEGKLTLLTGELEPFTLQIYMLDLKGNNEQ